MENWLLFPTEQYKRDVKKYAKKHPHEHKAITGNLDTYYRTLRELGHPMQIKAGFIHRESDGIKAIDQKGGKRKIKLEETRLYVYPDVTSKTLYLLKIGSKSSQKKIDTKFCRNFVKKIQKGDNHVKKV